MFERIPVPNVSWVDEQLERKQGETANIGAACVLWLRLGLTVESICPFDENAYLVLGVAYLKEFYKKQWNGSWDALFTPTFVAEDQRKRRRVKNQLEKFRSYRPRLDIPTTADIDRALDEKKKVSVLLKVPGKGTEPTAHTVLIYDRKGDDYLTYFPFPEDTLTDIPRKAFLGPDKDWMPQEGIVIIGQ